MAHHRQSHYGSQNDQMEDLLQSKVGSLKDIAIKIGDEAKYQNKLLRDMENDFDKTGGFLGSTMDKLKDIASKGYGKMWCYLFMWIMGISFFMYFILRLR